MPANFVKSFFTRQFNRWLSKRVPGRSQHKLTRKNIFIMPTKFGFAYLFFVLLLFLLATNYQNNIIMLMSYLLASLFITVMMHSFYNFAGLQLNSKAKYSGFAKQVINIPVTLTATRQHLDLKLNIAQQPEKVVLLEQCNPGSTEVILPYIAQQRGIVNSGRIKVASEYSFGLFVAWAVLDFSHRLTVYPQPKKINANQYRLSGKETDNETNIDQSNNVVGIDDFAELKGYVLGESRSRIAWKQFARGQGRYTKHYQNQKANLHWLKLNDMPNTSLEIKLSYLCYLVLEYSQNEHVFGLDLLSNSSNSTLEQQGFVLPSIGFNHQQTCLTALANFNQDSNRV